MYFFLWRWKKPGLYKHAPTASASLEPHTSGRNSLLRQTYLSIYLTHSISLLPQHSPFYRTVIPLLPCGAVTSHTNLFSALLLLSFSWPHTPETCIGFLSVHVSYFIYLPYPGYPYLLREVCSLCQTSRPTVPYSATVRF